MNYPMSPFSNSKFPAFYYLYTKEQLSYDPVKIHCDDKLLDRTVETLKEVGKEIKSYTEELKDDIKLLIDDTKKLEHAVETLEGDNITLKSAVSALQSDNKKLKNQIVELQKEGNGLRKKMALIASFICENRAGCM